MVPRMKQATKGKGKAIGFFDHHHFFSKETEERYEQFYSTKPLLAERGFELKGQVLEKVGAEIERGKVELTREFYANLEDAKLNKVWLLGRWVSFSAETINKVLGIPNEKQHELFTGMRIDELAEFLCPVGTEWAIKNGRFCHFPRRDTTLEAQAWLYFVCVRLIPAKHYTEVTTDRCRVLYAITAGLTINIGKIIHQEILKVTPHKKTLPFPTLITLLSMNAGPEEGYTEVTYLDCPPPITERTLSRIKVNVTRERKNPTEEETMKWKKPWKSLEERRAKYERKLERFKQYNLAMWQLWAETNNIPEDRLPKYETSEEEESDDEASSSKTE